MSPTDRESYGTRHADAGGSCVLALVLALATVPVAADEDDVHHVPRVTGEVRVDGVLDEAVWASAVRISLDLETRPGENIEPPVSTTALIMEDGSNLYVAFQARDPDPGAIRAFLRDRDEAYSDDFVGIVLDTFNDERRAYEFFANPLGVQMDLINDDVNGSEDDSWDAIWDSAGRIVDEGYVVEMRIPFRALRFPDVEGAMEWGVDLLRFYPREHRFRLSNNRQDRDRNCYLCQLATLEGMAEAEPGRNIELTPTLTSTASEHRAGPNSSLEDGPTDTEFGLDLRWGITPDLSLNATVNPDFSQVEADAAQLDVNRQFALFFPEKRPFFLEAQEIFDSRFNVVHTRNVADPDFGLKLSGKSGDDTYGVFAAEDSLTTLLIPGAENSAVTSVTGGSTDFVGRYRRDMGENSALGMIVTSREGESYRNSVYGIDGLWRIDDNHSVSGQWLRSDTRYPDAVSTAFGQPGGAFSDDALTLEYDYDDRNWFAYLDHRDIGQGFRADLGFMPQVDFEKQIAGFGRRWYPQEDADTWWTRLQLNGDWDITHDQSGQLLERELEVYGHVQGQLQSFAELGLARREKVFSGVRFDERWVQTYSEIQPSRGLFFGIFARDGRQADIANLRLGDRLLLEPRARWNLGQHFQIEWRHRRDRLDTLDGQRIFLARVDDIRLSYQFSIRSRLRLIIQNQVVERNPAVHDDPVQRRDEGTGWQLLYSYKINPQTVFFLGSSGQAVDRDDLSGTLLTDRSVFLKISYAWIP